MTSKKLYLSSFLLIILSVPWFYIDNNSNIFGGFPAWAFYSLTVTLIYAILVAYMLGKYWSISSEDKKTKK